MISVIIPTYNRADLLSETLNSLCVQTFQNFEVIVVDDGSSDDTRQRFEDFAGISNFRYVYQENQGRSAARNHGLKLANGEYVMFLDSDDLLTTEALSDLDELSRRFPESGVIGGSRKFIDDNGNFLDINDELAIKEDFLNRKVILEKIRGFFLPPSSYMIKKNVVEKLGGFDSTLEPCEDFDLFLKYCDAVKLTVTTKTILHMRRHEGNTPPPQLFKALMKIATINYESLIENKQNYPLNLLKEMKVEWQLKMADDHYALGERQKAFVHYLTAIKVSPTSIFNKNVFKHLLLNSMPASFRKG